MKFVATPLAGAFVIELERIADERGFFARSFCEDEFRRAGLETSFVQCSVSYNARKGTLRGMHYQRPPHAEAKIIRCTRGAIHDVIVDVRPSSPTYGQWFATELSAENYRMLYVPKEFAHGFQTLVDGSDILYMMSERYHPEVSGGLRWNDPRLGIRWPLPEPILSPRDAGYPDFAF